MGNNEEIKEEVIENDNVIEGKTQIQEEQTKMPPKKKRSILGVILSIISFLLFIFIVFETVIAFLNFNLIRNNKEPEYFVTTTKETKGENKYTIHDMGLYKIVRKDTTKNYEIRLLPFFMNHE